MTDACDLSAVEARRLIGLRQLSPVELLESCLRRIEATNGAVNAIVAMDADAARKRAKAIEEAIGRGDDLGLLAGAAPPPMPKAGLRHDEGGGRRATS